MKQRNGFKTPPLFKSDKNFSDISKTTNIKDLMRLLDTANAVANNLKRPNDLHEWEIYVTKIIPEFEHKTEFLEKLKGLINEYSDEPEGSDPA